MGEVEVIGCGIHLDLAHMAARVQDVGKPFVAATWCVGVVCEWR